MESTTLEQKDVAAHVAHAHSQIVQDLKKILKEDPTMEIALLDSLMIASTLAKKDLNGDLFYAINNEFNGNGWPTTLEGYYDYLDIYVRMVPNESNDPNYPNAWSSTGEKNGYNQKVYDLLCQFYWLVDQKVPGTQLSMQSYEKFADWLVEFATDWGNFLDTPESLTKESLMSFKHDNMYNYWLYSDNAASWKTFNEFFHRDFNNAAPGTGITPLRPIAEPDHNGIVVSPADCTYKMDYAIDSTGNVMGNDGKPASIILKNTHSIGTVSELLDGSEYSDAFNGGTFVHYFLSPFDYHRFHTPVIGKVLEIKPVTGKVYLDVSMTSDGQFDAPDASSSGNSQGYEFTQSRGVVVMDGGPEVGKVAIIPIGMCQVSGVTMYENLQGKNVAKGQEFGYFSFGGSDIIMLFEKPQKDLYLFKRDPGHIAIHFQYGQAAVYPNNK